MNITPFSFEEFEIRTTVIENDPWFIGKDVASALGYKNTRDALSRHVDNEDKRVVAFADHLGNEQKTTIINESGLYSLILRSKLESAKAFKRWVTSEVLPALRKTGSYTIQQPPTHAEALRGWADEIEIREELERQLEAAQPAIEFVEYSVNTEGTFSFDQAAKLLRMKTADGRPIGRNLLVKGLFNLGILMKSGNHKVPKQEHVNAGRFEVKYSLYQDDQGREFSTPTTQVTSKGLQWIRGRLISVGCSPVQQLVLVK